MYRGVCAIFRTVTLGRAWSRQAQKNDGLLLMTRIFAGLVVILPSWRVVKTLGSGLPAQVQPTTSIAIWAAFCGLYAFLLESKTWLVGLEPVSFHFQIKKRTRGRKNSPDDN